MRALDENLTDALVTSDEFDSFDYNLRQEIEELAKVDYDSQSDSWKGNTLGYAYLWQTEKLLRAAGLMDEYTFEMINELKERMAVYRDLRLMLQTIRLATITVRAGIIPEMAHFGEGFRKRQSKVASRHRTTGGLTPEERQGRNEKIVAHFKKTFLTLHGFATRHAAKYDLSPTSIKNIIKPTD